MSNKQKFDTPFHINYIKVVAEQFNLVMADPKFKLPEGDWWQKNQPINFYHGYFGAIQIAMNGLEAIGKVPGATVETLHAELHLMLGQVANFIVEKAPKIEVIDK